MTRCKTCEKELCTRNRSGFCRAHVMQAHILKDPAARKRKAEGNRRAMMARPDLRQANSRRFKERRIWEIGNASMPAGSEPRQRAGRHGTDTRLADIPQHLRDDYRALSRSHGMNASEARRLIFWQAAHEDEVHRRKLAEFHS